MTDYQPIQTTLFSSLAYGSYIFCEGHVKIGKHVCIGRNVNIMTGSHNIHSPHFELITKPITIENNVWVATGATVLPGILLSKNPVVAAGSVVIFSTEENDIIEGNPARFLKKRHI